MLWRTVRPSCLVRPRLWSCPKAEKVPSLYARITTRQITSAATDSQPGHVNAVDAATDNESLKLKPTSHSRLLRQPPPQDIPVKVAGNVHSKRTHKKVAFLFVGDGSTHEPIQAVLPPDGVNK